MSESLAAVGGVVEESAGGVLIQRTAAGPLALLIRVRAEGFEVPKGHVEAGECLEDAALRELREEAGLLSAAEVRGMLGELRYSFESGGRTIHKRVVFFHIAAGASLEFGPRPRRTRETRWVDAGEAERIELVNEELRPLVLAALEETI